MKLESSKIKLKTKDRDVYFKKEFSKLKIKVALNWFELVALFLVAFFIVLKASFMLQKDYVAASLFISLLISTSVVLLFSSFRKHQLRITRFDKEHIYKKISEDLFEQSKLKY